MDWSRAGPSMDVRPLFPRERADMLTLLRGLDASGWQRPTVCPGWRVHDVVAHVVHDYIRKLSGRRDRFLAPGPVAGETLPVFLDRVNQEFVDVAARWSPQVLIDLLGLLGPELDRMWESLDLDQLGEAVSWAAPDVPAPVWLDVAREYTEYWVHQQQVRDAVGVPGADDDQLTFPVMDAFVRAAPYALRLVPAVPGTCVQIRVTGAGAGTWTVRRRDGDWAVTRGPAAESPAADSPAGKSPAAESPAAEVVLPSGCLWRVATRGISVETARAQATVTGDETLASAVLSLVSIVRSP
jgi:uncharacterized protein (TIGR03083 family)